MHCSFASVYFRFQGGFMEGYNLVPRNANQYQNPSIFFNCDTYYKLKLI